MEANGDLCILHLPQSNILYGLTYLFFNILQLWMKVSSSLAGLQIQKIWRSY